MTKHFCFLSIVLVGLLSIFTSSCDQGMDTVVDTVTNPPSPTEPATNQSYIYHDFFELRVDGSVYDVVFDSEGTLVSLGEGIEATGVELWRILPNKQLIESYFFPKSEFEIGPLGDFVRVATTPIEPFGIVRVATTPIVAIGVAQRVDDNIEISFIGDETVAASDSISLPSNHTSLVRAFAYTEDQFATGSSDKTVHIWEVQHQAGVVDPVYTHKHTLEHEGQVWAVAFSPDGQTLASGGGFEGIYLWDVETGQSKGAPLIANTAQVEGIAFSSDGQTLAVATGLGTGEAIHLWDLGTNQLTETLMAPQLPETLLEPGGNIIIRKVAISPDGQIIAGGGYSHPPPNVLGKNAPTVVLWKRK